MAGWRETLAQIAMLYLTGLLIKWAPLSLATFGAFYVSPAIGLALSISAVAIAVFSSSNSALEKNACVCIGEHQCIVYDLFGGPVCARGSRGEYLGSCSECRLCGYSLRCSIRPSRKLEFNLALGFTHERSL